MESCSCAWRLTSRNFVDGRPLYSPSYSRNCRTSTASPAEAGDLPWLLVVPDLEGDTPVVERDQATVRDGDPVGTARQIDGHGLRPSKPALGMNEPALVSEIRADAKYR